MIGTTTYRNVILQAADGIATVSLANPQKRNALSVATLHELLGAFEAIGRDETIKAVILSALGPAFSSGHDLRELQCAAPGAAGSEGPGPDEADLEKFREIFDLCVRVMTLLQTIPQPVIAEVAGIATAAGCQLVATCDLAIASTEARFATPGVKIGLFCTTPMVALTRSIGRKRAMEMLLTGDFIDAATAERWGLVNRVVAPEALRQETLALARKIVAASGWTVGLGKAAFYAQIDLAQSDAYAYAKEVMSANAVAADAREGIAAFLERRTPAWSR